MTEPTLSEIARDYTLWEEYVDRQGLMSRTEFESIPMPERLRMLVQDMGLRDEEPSR